MNEEKAEYRNKQRSSFWGASLLWCLLLVLAYYGVEIVEAGKQLNTLTEYPIWGYVLWGFIVIVLWVLIIGPIIHFTNLRYVGEESLRRQVLRAKDALGAYRHEPSESELRQLADEFAAAPTDFTTLEGRYGWQELLARFREAVHRRAHDTIIGCCKAAGLGMVFGFNGLLDGLVLLAIQVRLSLSLARMYGFKPTSFFNGCFFGWIAANSLVVALLSGALDSLSASMVGAMLGSTGAADMESVRAGLEWVFAVLMQALLAGVLTFATGCTFLWRLEHEGREVALKTLLKLQAEGRKEYAAKLAGATEAMSLMNGELPASPSTLSGRLLQFFGYRPENKAATAALMNAAAASEAAQAPAKLPQPAAAAPAATVAPPVRVAEPVPTPAPATPALEPAAPAVVATPALEVPDAPAKPDAVEEALKGERLSS